MLRQVMKYLHFLNVKKLLFPNFNTLQESMKKNFFWVILLALTSVTVSYSQKPAKTQDAKVQPAKTHDAKVQDPKVQEDTKTQLVKILEDNSKQLVRNYDAQLRKLVQQFDQNARVLLDNHKDQIKNLQDFLVQISNQV